MENPNNESLVGGYVELAKSDVKSVTTTWSDATSDYKNPSNTDGLQLQVRIYGKATPSGGGSGSIRIDNARGGGT